MTGLSPCSCMKWVGKFKKNPSTKVFKKTGEIMLAVKPISQFRWSRHWVVTLSCWPFLFHPFLKLEGDVKEPVTLFEKSRGHRPQCHGLSDLCRRQSGWVRCDQNMDWSGCKGAPLHADDQSHLSGSSAIQPLAASGESWHGIYIYFLLFFLNLGWHQRQGPGVP